MNMATKALKDTYDYVLIGNGSPDSYFISSEVDSVFLNDSVSFPTNGMLINATFFDETNNTLVLLNNGSGTLDTNGTRSADDIGELIIMTATSIVLGLMILITVIGNVFVIAAIILERNLQNVANYLVASLAVADLFVACLVMPLGAVYEISKGWILGPELCDIWTSCDVLCCTASILHLVAIATDRYWAVTNVDYIHSRTRGRVFTMIFLVWFAAVIVSLAPQFGWKDPEYLERIEQQRCMVSQDVSYQVFATCCTFYVPLLVILILYWKIYQTARKRIHRRRPRPIDVTANNNQPAVLQKKKTRLKIRLVSKFSSQGKSAASSLGLVEGNSTNTVNTVEDTEYSANLSDTKKGIEVTTFNNPVESSTSSTNQISTVSHLVSIANQTKNQNSHQNQKMVSNTLPTSSISTSSSSKHPSSINQITTSSTPATAVTSSTTSSPPTTTPTTTLTAMTVATGGGAGRETVIETAVATTTSVTTPATISLQIQQQQQQQQQCLNQVATPIQQNKQVHLLSNAPQLPPTPATPLSSIPNPHSQVTKRKETLEAKRERKAAKTLAIITGAFVVCWLPFFLMALLLPLCGDSCYINDTISSLFLWLGYFNSTLNPVIYTIFSPEFRQAFKRILFGGHRQVFYRSGKI